MTAGDDHERELGGDEALAAEYVLGVLPAEERRIAGTRIDRDAGFARLVEQWEARLAPMAAGYSEVAPPASVRTALERRLFGQAPQAATTGFWGSLALWRGLAAAALAALALVIAVPMMRDVAPTPTTSERLVASLAGDGSDVRYLALFDPSIGRVGLSHVSGARAQGRDFELWVIEGENPPRSLGVIPEGATVSLDLDSEARAGIDSGAVFAISLEPAGGSPTGAPTGPVVAAGDLRGI